MKLRRVLALLMTAAVLFVTGCSNADSQKETQTAQSEQKTVRVGVSGDYYPMCYMENDEGLRLTCGIGLRRKITGR